MTHPDTGAPHADSPTRNGQDEIPRADSENPRLPPGQAVDRIIKALKDEPSLRGFLPAAESTLLATTDEFTAQLGAKAIQIASGRKATAVDREDVKAADRYLRENVKVEKRAWMLGVAGLMGGGAIAISVAILAAPETLLHVNYWWTTVGVCGAIAFVLFSLSYPRATKRS